MQPEPIPRDDPRAPKYWKYETGNLLAVAIERFLKQEHMYPSDILLMRAYLRQWVDSPVWDMAPNLNDEGRRALAELRKDVRDIERPSDIDEWLENALELAIDPL